jgi:hypothetical protein
MKVLLLAGLAVGVSGLGCDALGLASGQNSPPGVVTAYKPVTYYDRIRRDCGSGCKLLKMVAKNVASDGTMDLTKTGLVTFEFKNLKRTKKVKVKGKKKKKKASKVVSSGKGKYEKVIITVPKIGGSSRVNKMVMGRSTRTYNVRTTHSATVKGPTCKVLDLWKQALAKGADGAYLANITYDRDGYLFEIKSKGFKMAFNQQCKPSWAPSKLVRPVQDFSGVASLAPKNAEFTELTARQVRSDGTADTSLDPAWVRYRFFWTEPLKRTEEVAIMLRGGGVRKNRRFLTLGVKPKGVPAPTCKFSDLWQTALKKGAGKDRTAQITYDGKGYGFRQENPQLILEFDLECKLKKK